MLSENEFADALRQYAGAEQARAAFDAASHALETCKSEQYQGEEVGYALMAAPKVGDGALGVELTVQGSEAPQYFVLVGPSLIDVGGGGLTNADNDLDSSSCSTRHVAG